MEIFRKNLFFPVFILMIICLSGTSGFSKDISPENQSSFTVVTSFYPAYIMALNVTKEVPDISVMNLTRNFIGCLHDYALTTDDLKKLSKAQVFVANGAGLESFLDKVARERANLNIITLSDDVSLLRDDHDYTINPHVWVSIPNAVIQVDNLAKGLSRVDPVHARLYRKNADAYISKLQSLYAKMRDELAPYRGRKIITFHEAFPYFARDFGFEIAVMIEREPGSVPGPRELADIVKLVKKEDVKTLFVEPQYPLLSAEIIARETGARVAMLDPAATGPDDPDAYTNIMEKNLETLKTALQ